MNQLNALRPLAGPLALHTVTIGIFAYATAAARTPLDMAGLAAVTAIFTASLAHDTYRVLRPAPPRDLKDKLRHEMKGSAVGAVLWLAVSGLAAYQLTTGHTAGGRVLEGVTGVISLAFAGACVNNVRKTRRLQRSPLLYLVAILHDLGSFPGNSED